MKFKHSNTDFTAQSLPKNRKEVFKDVFKLHYWKLLGCGMIIFLFALPLHISAITSDFYQSYMINAYNAGNITLEQVTASLVTFAKTRYAIEIVLYALFGLGFAAVARIIRQLAWEEPVSVRYDFIKGIKQNGLQFVLMFLIFGLINFACNYLTNVFQSFTVMWYLGAVLSVISVLVFAPAEAYMTVAIPIYGNRFTKNASIGFMMYFKHPFKSLGILILLFIPFAIQMIPNLVCHLVGRILSSLLAGIIYLIWFLVSSNWYDKIINENQAPELVAKGVLGREKNK